jgi:hypothetical protein
MTARRKNGDPVADLEGLLIIGILGVVGYVAYKAWNSAPTVLQKTGNQLLYGASFTSTDIVPGTGQTVAELEAIGWTPAQIGAMFQQDTQDWFVNNGAVDMSIPTF